MEDFVFNIARGVVGLLFGAVLVFCFYVFVIKNYQDFDMKGLDMVQTRQGIYSNGLTLEEAMGSNNQGRIFTPEHMVMFHIVDCDVYLNSAVTETRLLRIYDKLLLREGTTIPFTSTLKWRRTYTINLASVQNRALIVRSFNIPLPNDTPSTLSWAGLVNLALVPGDTAPQSVSHPRGGWYGVVNGKNNGRSDWLLYSAEQNDRLLIPMPKEIGDPTVPANLIPGFN